MTEESKSVKVSRLCDVCLSHIEDEQTRSLTYEIALQDKEIFSVQYALCDGCWEKFRNLFTEEAAQLKELIFRAWLKREKAP